MNLKPRFYNIKRTHKRCRNYPYPNQNQKQKQKEKGIQLREREISFEHAIWLLDHGITGGGTGGGITEDICGIERMMRISGGHLSDLNGEEEPYGSILSKKKKKKRMTKRLFPLSRGIWRRSSVAWPRRISSQSPTLLICPPLLP